MVDQHCSLMAVLLMRSARHYSINKCINDSLNLCVSKKSMALEEKEKKNWSKIVADERHPK